MAILGQVALIQAAVVVQHERRFTLPTLWKDLRTTEVQRAQFGRLIEVCERLETYFDRILASALKN
jgi:hypothetical protein